MFPLSLQTLDCQVQLCASLGAFSTAPFLPQPAGLTSPAAFSGLVAWWFPAGFWNAFAPRPTEFGGSGFFVVRKTDTLDNS